MTVRKATIAGRKVRIRNGVIKNGWVQDYTGCCCLRGAAHIYNPGRNKIKGFTGVLKQNGIM